MERHERYDPEDIESLLSERGFDELLPDERAFVLRHLSNRDEYERLRALLHYVRPDERERGTIEPDDRVRNNVLAAFRAQQQPQWRIWLNGISLWLAPKETTSYWRPALAFSSLALLIVAGVVAVRQFDGSNDTAAIAELKQEEQPAAPPAPVKDDGSVRGVTEEREAPVALEQQRSSTAQAGEVTTPRADAADMAAPTMVHREMDAKIHAGAEDRASSEHTEAEMLFETTVPASAVAKATEDLVLPHVVTPAELARNASVTNTAGEVAMEVASRAPRRKLNTAQEMVTSRSLADDPGILSLVAAGW